MNVRYDMVVVYVVRPAADDGGHELLQLKRRDEDYMGGTWQFCSGQIEPGETAPQAALRELREETGLAPRRFTHLSYVESLYIAATDTVWHRTGFCAAVDRADAVKLNPEHTACRWIARRDVRRLVTWPGERAALAEVFREHLRPSLGLAHRLLDPNRLPTVKKAPS